MLQPFNRHILITPEYIEREKKKEQSTILLPDDYTKVEGKYCSAIVNNTAKDCRFEDLTTGTRILVDRAMIEEVEFEGKTHHLILDNYVIAQIKE
jgi:co-chaperonin GroES (HSP10)